MKYFFVTAVAIVLSLMVNSWLVQQLWNFVMPLFNLPIVTFWQASALYVLANIFFRNEVFKLNLNKDKNG